MLGCLTTMVTWLLPSASRRHWSGRAATLPGQTVHLDLTSFGQPLILAVPAKQHKGHSFVMDLCHRKWSGRLRMVISAFYFGFQSNWLLLNVFLVGIILLFVHNFALRCLDLTSPTAALFDKCILPVDIFPDKGHRERPKREHSLDVLMYFGFNSNK